MTHWKTRNTIIALIIYWVLLSLNAYMAKLLEYSHSIEWRLSTIIFLSIVLLCILTYVPKLNIFYRLLLIPAALLVHAILTAPAAQLLGIIMLDPDHIRTNGEHRAVFIIASLPILVFVMKKSKLFTEMIFIDKTETE